MSYCLQTIFFMLVIFAYGFIAGGAFGEAFGVWLRGWLQ